MAFRHSKTRAIVPDVEMTSMIDIVFLLIIFFMVAAQFAQQARVDLNLPEEVGEQSSETFASALIVSIQADGTILIDRSAPPLQLADLDMLIGQTLSRGDTTWQSITVRADESAPASVLNKVLLLLNKHGLAATRIATERP